jgi:hypothetical protein
MLRAYLRWSGLYRRWYRTSTLGERIVTVTIFGGGPLLEIVAGSILAVQPPTVLAIHYGLYFAGFGLIGATWVMLGFFAYLYTARPVRAIPNWMNENRRPSKSGS